MFPEGERTKGRIVVVTASVAVGLVVLLAWIHVCDFHESATVLDRLYGDIKLDGTSGHGGEKRLTPVEYVHLKLTLSEQRQILQLRLATILFGLICGAVGGGLLLLVAAPGSKVTDPRFHASGLILIVVGALVVLLAPRNKAPSLDELQSSSAAAPETPDAGSPPPAQDAGSDAGVQAQ